MSNNADKRSVDFLSEIGLYEQKILGRIGRATRRLGSRGSLRRTLKPALFDANARDADGDGRVQDSTRFERPASPDVSQIKPSIESSPSRAQINRSRYEGTIIRELDARKVSEFRKRIVTAVEERFGKITTKEQAQKAFEEVAGKNFIFSLNPENGGLERGLIYGYLFSYLENPELKDNFVGLDPAGGLDAFNGSAQMMAPWSKVWDYELESSKTIDTLGILLTYNPFTTYWSSASGDDIPEGIVDGTSAQSIFSYFRNNPDNLDLEELKEETAFVGSLTVAQHETAHVLNFLRATRDAFPGKKLDATLLDEIQKLLDSPDEKKNSRIRIENSVLYESLVGTHESLDYLTSISTLIDDSINDLAKKRASTDPSKRTWQQIKETEYGALRKEIADEFLSLGALNKEGRQEYVKSVLPDRDTMDRKEYFEEASKIEKRLSPITSAYLQLQRLEEGLDLKKSDKSILKTFLESEQGEKDVFDDAQVEYQKLIDSFVSDDLIKNNSKLIALLEDEKQYFTSFSDEEKLSHNQNKTMLIMEALRSDPDGFNQIARNIFANEDYMQRMMKMFKISDIDQQPDLSIEEYLLTGKYSTKINDNLSRSEVNAFIEWSKSVSDYASNPQYSYYSNFFNSTPIEGIAEMVPALEFGLLPQKGTPEWNAVKKMAIWLKGESFWKRVSGEK